jgi:hypothetical protein
VSEVAGLEAELAFARYAAILKDGTHTGMPVGWPRTNERRYNQLRSDERRHED